MSKDTTARDKSRATDDEPSEKVQKRAQWESFAFSVVEPRTVRVENHSYGEDAVDEHTYRVDVEHGSAASCTCPADEHHSGACKHRTAVEQNAPVLAAASGVVTDGGEVLQEDSDDVDETGRPDDCDCGEWNDGLGLSCWPCYAAGFRTPASLDAAGDDAGDDDTDDDRDRPRRSEPADFGGGESTGVQDLLGGDDA